ncbi:MAG TPA: hypothetical protein DEF45_04285 [Rhodopirellula sp.]|nr:hypothetical protein [Rhodopirellula sp.]
MLGRFALVLILVGSVPLCATCFACLWDRDTLAMERQRNPTTLELITGKFLRHSADFYRWRAEDRRERIEAEPSPELYDDLAVALEKVGETKQAIRVMETKASLYPGLYATHANLGTFYVHSKQLDLGLAEITTAIAINPNAHFGRELYQKRLVEYLVSRGHGDHPKLPLSGETPSGMGPVGFGGFLVAIDPEDVPREDPALTIDKAIAGVLGMMKFGNHDSPVLLEALGDLLVSRGYESDGKQLAARAYLKASYEAEELDAQKSYRDKAKNCLRFQTIGGGSNTTLTLAELESQFAEELLDARSWYETIVRKEKGWLASGANVEEAFEREYYAQPEVGSMIAKGPNATLWGVIVAVVAAVSVVLLLAILRQRRNISRKAV